MKTNAIINRLNEITVGHTTTIGDVVVTRWTAGWELETVGRKLDAVTAEYAAERIQERTQGVA